MIIHFFQIKTKHLSSFFGADDQRFGFPLQRFVGCVVTLFGGGGGGGVGLGHHAHLVIAVVSSVQESIGVGGILEKHHNFL